MNHDHFIGDHDLSVVSKVKSGASRGMVVLEAKWFSRALVALHLLVESERLIVSPSAFVLVCGTLKLTNFDPLDVTPHLIFVECVT